MDFEAVIACLENNERREEFIKRLKNAGENSSPVLQIQNAMTDLKMHKAPKGIFERTMLQNMFRFCEPDECFQTFRLVCKPWQNAVEPIRFDQILKPHIFFDLDNKITDRTIISTNYFDKYLPAFKQVCIPLNLENKDAIFALILKNMKKMNELIFIRPSDQENIDPFIHQMIKNSSNTLVKLRLPKFVIPHAAFPKMTELTLKIGKEILLENFETHFPRALENMQHLKKVRLFIEVGRPWPTNILSYITQNYKKHCVSGRMWGRRSDLLNYTPLKIAYSLNLKNLLNIKIYASHLEHAHVITSIKNPMDHGWDRYQEIFDQCTNLKAIEANILSDENFFQDILPILSEPLQEIWKERISYFEKRGIRLVNKHNENVENKLAKEAGIRWRFEFL